MKPKISVIIPVYNSESFFAKTLERVLRQTQPAHEVIVINDGSIDGTQAVIDRYKGRILTKTIPNSGCGAARNAGARMASGDILAFLDADDLWFRTRLDVMTGWIEKHPGAGFFCTDYLVFSDHHGRIVKHFDHIPNRADLNFDAPLKKHPLELLLKNNFVGTPSNALVRKSLFDELGGYDEDCRLVEDLEFFFRCAERTDFLVVGRPLFYKHDHVRSLSFDKVKLYENHKKMMAGYLSTRKDLMHRLGMTKKAALGMAGVDLMLGGLYFETGKTGLAYRTYWEALCGAPYPSIIARFFWRVLKKTLRLLSGGLFSRKNLEKVLSAEKKTS